jgi:hypothetical protein
MIFTAIVVILLFLLLRETLIIVGLLIKLGFQLVAFCVALLAVAVLAVIVGVQKLRQRGEPEYLWVGSAPLNFIVSSIFSPYG